LSTHPLFESGFCQAFRMPDLRSIRSCTSLSVVYFTSVELSYLRFRTASSRYGAPAMLRFLETFTRGLPHLPTIRVM
jgi:hypothetical protein